MVSPGVCTGKSHTVPGAQMHSYKCVEGFICLCLINIYSVILHPPGKQRDFPIALPCLPNWLSSQRCGSYPWPPEGLHLRQNIAKYASVFLTVVMICNYFLLEISGWWWESRLSVFADHRVVRAIRNCRSIRRLLYISCKPEGEAMRNFLE